jgi:hypothetical protein
MTCPIVPDFIFQLFEKEITKLILLIVDKICDIHNLDKNQVKNQLNKELKINFKIVSEDIEQIKIVKKHQNIKIKNMKEDTEDAVVPDKNEKKEANVENVKDDKHHICHARIFQQNELCIKRCSRPKSEGVHFCKLHQRLSEEGKLKYGTIFDERPEEITSKKLSKIVKNRIY